MSRIGKIPVEVPAGVSVDLKPGKLGVKGPNGELSIPLHPSLDVKMQSLGASKSLFVSRHNELRDSKAQHGRTRAMIRNMIEGVTKGYTKNLEIHGVGYDAEMVGSNLNLKLGFANTITLKIPVQTKLTVTNQTVQGNRIVYIKVTGADKQIVGQFAASIRQCRPPEPYKQKGVRYADEAVIKKQGKAATGGK